jgi:hypothetical protein
MVCHIGNRESCILEQASSSDKACHREVALRCRNARSEEAAHHRAREYVEVCGKLPDIANAWRAGENRLEESPAVLRSAGKVDIELSEYGS